MFYIKVKVDLSSYRKNMKSGFDRITLYMLLLVNCSV